MPSHVDEPSLVFDIRHFDGDAAVFSALGKVPNHFQNVVVDEV
jgi:hypothetical protein